MELMGFPVGFHSAAEGIDAEPEAGRADRLHVASWLNAAPPATM
jgi:hypothetical protein